MACIKYIYNNLKNTSKNLYIHTYYILIIIQYSLNVYWLVLQHFYLLKLL